MHQKLCCALRIAISNLVYYKLKKSRHSAVRILRPPVNFLGQYKRVNEQPIIPGERNVNEVQLWLSLAEVEGV